MMCLIYSMRDCGREGDMIRESCLSVRRFKTWNGNIPMICVSVGQRSIDACVFKCKCCDQMRRKWLRVWDGLADKDRPMDVIKYYVEETMKWRGRL